MLDVYIGKVERPSNRKVKIIRSYRDSKLYDKYNELG